MLVSEYFTYFTTTWGYFYIEEKNPYSVKYVNYNI